MRWAEVALVTELEAAETVADILISEGCGGVAAADSSARVKGRLRAKTRLAAYFPVDERLPATLDRIKTRIESLTDFGPNDARGEMTVKFVEDADWAEAWKSFFKPVVVGGIVIKPTWEEFDAQPGQVVVELDPGMAFGTGNHPTTRMCLSAMRKYLKPGGVVLDMGCGSGILAIAAARLGASMALGIDVDPVAVKAAAENVQTNGVGSVVEIAQGDWPEAVVIEADLAFANIAADAIVGMRESLANALKPGGVLVSSGIIDERREQVETALQQSGLKTIETLHEGEWVSIISRRER